jgi:hypothetical protein
MLAVHPNAGLGACFRATCAPLILAFLVAGATPGLQAGPPFLTDDPEPVDLNHWEFYVFGQGDRSDENDAVSGPAIEFNYGFAPDAQFHLIAPIANLSTPGNGRVSGYGDTEVGVKYRLFGETDSRPQVGVFPMAEIASGNAERGLGNGKTWYRIPVWAQKSWGAWTTYGGGGFALNSAPGQRNSGFAGWLIQRDLGTYLTLGTELFWQGSDTNTGRGVADANVGGYIKFTENFNLLFSMGHSVSGERNTVWYLGLYWTGGPAATDKK